MQVDESKRKCKEMKLDNILDMVKKTAISDFGTGKTEKGIKNQTLKKSEKGG